MGAEGSGIDPSWLGLTAEMSGPDFETQLDRFLHVNRTVESADEVLREFQKIGGGPFAAQLTLNHPTVPASGVQ